MQPKIHFPWKSESVKGQGPRSKFSSWGGGGGGGGGGLESEKSEDEPVRGVRAGVNFDFNSSQMPRNAFKINQRNPY